MSQKEMSELEILEQCPRCGLDFEDEDPREICPVCNWPEEEPRDLLDLPGEEDEV